MSKKFGFVKESPYLCIVKREEKDMTQAELRFFESVPNRLSGIEANTKRIAEALESIAKSLEKLSKGNEGNNE